jgi:hypothetical protein
VVGRQYEEAPVRLAAAYVERRDRDRGGRVAPYRLEDLDVRFDADFPQLLGDEKPVLAV